MKYPFINGKIEDEEEIKELYHILSHYVYMVYIILGCNNMDDL